MSINIILIISMLCMISATAWVFFMTQSGDLFDFFPGIVEKIFPYRKFKKLHKLLYQCERCLAGQIALWSYPVIVYCIDWRYFWIEHIFTVFTAIFMAGITALIIQRLQ